MNLLSFFNRRADGRCEPKPDTEQLERDLSARLERRKAARLAAQTPHAKGWATRRINAGAL